MIATGVWVVLAGLLGLAIGSFLNVVIYRVPAGLSIVRPPSSCPRCGTEIRIRHNIPVLGWLMLRGRCYDCHEPISPRYPIVEALTGLLFAVLTARLVELHLSPAVAAYLVLAAAVVTLTMVEFDQGRLYGGITLTAAAMTAALLVAASIGSGAWWPLLRAAVAAVLVTGVGLAAVFACGRAVRVDAVEFAGLLAATLAYRSWTTLLVGAAIAAVLSGVAGAIGEYRHRRLQRFAVPFVACLVVAALTALMLPEL